jgi:oligoribonuclease (3'-5' exoribonuclease)
MYLSVDTETCGIGLDKSLLSIGLVLADEQFGILGEVELKCCPDNLTFNVTSESLRINKIELKQWDKNPTYKETKTILFHYLKDWSNNGTQKLCVVGKNVYFDLQQIWDKTLSRNTWEQFCSYRILDVTSVAQYLFFTGKIPPTVSGSLESLVDFYKIPKLECHNALNDSKMTLMVLKEMVNVNG